MEHTSRLMSEEEQVTLMLKADKLKRLGKDEEALEIQKQIPLAPHIARAVKETYGAGYLIENGFNLAEAEEAYGKDWLTK